MWKQIAYSLLFACFGFPGLRAQTTAPSGNSSICPYPFVIDTAFNLSNSGYAIGTVLPDITLFDNQGNPTSISGLVATGLPVLIISGSYTCPQFQNSLDQLIPFIQTNYGNTVEILIVYTFEAHPYFPDFSPFAASTWVLGPNTQAGIIYQQHIIYQDRLDLMAVVDSVYPTGETHVADDTCNTWQYTYGQSPNFAYILAPGGTIYSKYISAWNDRVSLLADLNALTALSVAPASTGMPLFWLATTVGGEQQLQHNSPEPFTWAVYDMSGRLIVREKHSSPDQPLPVSQRLTDAGCYILAVEEYGFTARITR